jgi:predicted DCC family thiol-disulfide oxidoreductase YuxK
MSTEPILPPPPSDDPSALDWDSWKPEPANRLWVLYDGPCVLCNATVRWLQKRDRFNRLHFAPHPDPHADGVAFWNGLEWLHGPMALAPLLGTLPAPYSALGWVLQRIPKWLIKKMYRWIAAHRYTWFGKNETLTACPIPHSSSEPQQRSC